MAAVQRMRKKAKDKAPWSPTSSRRSRRSRREGHGDLVVPANPRSSMCAYNQRSSTHTVYRTRRSTTPTASGRLFHGVHSWRHVALGYWVALAAAVAGEAAQHLYQNNNNFNQINTTWNAAGGRQQLSTTRSIAAGPVPNQNTANKYGGSSRGASAATASGAGNRTASADEQSRGVARGRRRQCSTMKPRRRGRVREPRGEPAR